MKPVTIFLIAIAIIAALLLFRRSSSQVPQVSQVSNVTVVDGTQYIDIDVKGGYRPQASVAKAGLPTVLRFKTSGTFDCSSAVRIPALAINKTLPPSGSTEITLGTLQAGTLEGTCSMGMYRFSIEGKI